VLKKVGEVESSCNFSTNCSKFKTRDTGAHSFTLPLNSCKTRNIFFSHVTVAYCQAMPDMFTFKSISQIFCMQLDVQQNRKKPLLDI